MNQDHKAPLGSPKLEEAEKFEEKTPAIFGWELTLALVGAIGLAILFLIFLFHK